MNLPLHHADHRYRTPTDLGVTPSGISRVLVIGSCLMAGVPGFMEHSGTGATGDYILFNNLSELPVRPPQPIEQYDFQLVQLATRSVIPEWDYFRLDYRDQASFAAWLDRAEERIHQMLKAALRWNEAHGTLTFVTNFFLPQHNPMGRLLPRYDLRNSVHFFERLNQALAREIAAYTNVFMLDIDQISAGLGRQSLQDDGLWMLAHGAVLSDFDHEYDVNRITPIGPASELYRLRGGEFLQAMWGELEAMYRTVRGIDAVKLVVVDLDDTLWRGVIAESLEVLPTTVEGWPLGFAEALLFLKQRGVLLAIVSKNSPEVIEGVWDGIFAGRLQLGDFAIRKISWKSKAESMDEVLKEANLLPRSVVFVDDNPVERQTMREAFPDMRIIGDHPYLMRRILLWSSETQVAVITDESSRRTELIQAQGERDSTRKRMSRPEFLASLGLRLELQRITGVDSPAFPRAFELINKTNQFNTNGHRWTQEECRALFAAGGVFHAFTVVDKFSDYGLVGVLVERGAALDQMVMSCRVIGLDVELAAIAAVVEQMRAGGHPAVTARVVETTANTLCRDLFERAGFVAEGEGWVLGGTAPPPPRPAYVTVAVTAA